MGVGLFGRQSVAARRIGRSERPARARIPAENASEWIGNGGQETLRYAWRQRYSQGIAVARRILDGNEPCFGGDANSQYAARGNQLLHIRGYGRGNAACADF